MTETRHEYLSRAEEKLNTLTGRIVDLESKADQRSGDDAGREMRALIETIRNSRERAEHRLRELRLASQPAWEEVREGVEEAWRSLSRAIDKANERLK
jgi:hypothetical protein